MGFAIGRAPKERSVVTKDAQTCAIKVGFAEDMEESAITKDAQKCLSKVGFVSNMVPR